MQSTTSLSRTRSSMAGHALSSPPGPMEPGAYSMVRMPARRSEAASEAAPNRLPAPMTGRSRRTSSWCFATRWTMSESLGVPGAPQMKFSLFGGSQPRMSISASKSGCSSWIAAMSRSRSFFTESGVWSCRTMMSKYAATRSRSSASEWIQRIAADGTPGSSGSESFVVRNSFMRFLP